MEPEGSLPCSQGLFLYPDTAESRLYSNNVFLFIITLGLLFHLYLGMTSGLFHSGFLTSLLCAHLCSPLCNIQR
jgi:hypothetical protein